MRRRLERWRERHGGRGQPIPAELWDEAVQVAWVEGVDATAYALRLDRGRLGRRMGLAAAPSGSSPEEAPRASDGFVELDAGGLCATGYTVLRFEGREGERLEVELRGASALDVAELARAFWSRPR
jgi:hypothetical protein